MRHSTLPHHLYVNVDNRFLGPNMPKGMTKGLWHGIYSRPGQAMQCHVLLESGAHWSGLPIHALSTTTDWSLHHSELQPWGGMGDQIECTTLPYLEGLRTDWKGQLGRHTGIIIDWTDGFSRDPQEHKPLSLLALDRGQFALLPNNYFRVEDSHFTAPDKHTDLIKHYRRGETVYWEGDRS